MWRLTMSDGAALLSPELNARERAAAIAAMASRLAAAAPRRRPHQEPEVEAAGMEYASTDATEDGPAAEAAEPLPDFARERLATVSVPPPAPWRQHIGTMRNVALLAVMAGSGFGAVVLALSPSVAAYFAGGPARPEAKHSTPPATPQPAQQAAIRPSPVHHGHALPAETGAPRAVAFAPHRTLREKGVAKANAEPAHTAPRKAAIRIAALPAPPAGPRQATPRAVAASYELPRWITEPQPAKAAAPAPETPQVVTMSPPPHDLALPQPEPARPGPTPAPANPRPAEMVFASSGAAQPPAYGWAPTRPPFDPPSWPGGASSYGGNYFYGSGPP